MRSIYLMLVCGTALTMGACNDSSTPDGNTNSGDNRTTPPTVVDRTKTVDRTNPDGTVIDRTRTDTTITRDDATPRSADNTGINKRDQDDAKLTPMDQPNAAEDIKLVASVRRAIMDDDTLSMTAKNIKIITSKGGGVTLRGPVNSDEERTKIETIVRAIAGVTSVTNELEVKPADKN